VVLVPSGLLVILCLHGTLCHLKILLGKLISCTQLVTDIGQSKHQATKAYHEKDSAQSKPTSVMSVVKQPPDECVTKPSIHS